MSFSAGAKQKTISGYGDGETKQGSERDMHKRTVRTDPEERVGREGGNENVPTFNVAASQHAGCVLQGLIGCDHGSQGALHFL